jgi:hypothetical protein
MIARGRNEGSFSGGVSSGFTLMACSAEDENSERIFLEQAFFVQAAEDELCRYFPQTPWRA